MLVGQFKELNRNLQEVMHTIKITIAGLKKTLELIIFLVIYMGTAGHGRFGKETGNSYEFEVEEGLAELEGLGISRFDDGNLISKFVLLLCKIQC
jgi:hypothetical protein